MRTESHRPEHDGSEAPRHADVSFESHDIKVASIYRYLIILGATTVVALIVCIFILRFTTGFVASEDVPPPQSREALGKNFNALPPEPRLQGVPGHTSDPQQDLRDKIKADTEANESSGWIDKPAGIAQIPVKDAMKIIAEKGLGVATGTPGEKK
jgi:hypothetical protein